MSTSHLILINESIYWWYGNGGDWINLGLQMYFTMDRKTNNGAGIQDTACSVSSIMIISKIVKGVQDYGYKEIDNCLLHGAKVLINLVKL